jgi:hypothetical protein
MTSKIIALRAWLKKRVAWFKHRFRRALIGRIPIGLAEQVAAVGWAIQGAFSAGCRASGSIRAEIARDVLGLAGDQVSRARSGGLLEKFIDQRIYFGRDIRTRESLPDLDAIAQTLAQRVATLKREAPERPVFMSPFHYVSQYANIYVVEKVAALLGIKSMAVVSGVPRNQYGDDHALIPGIKVLYTYGETNRGGLGVRVARALKRDGVAVLFSDVPPFTMHRYPMETVGVSMFGRDARIHNGVFRMGETFGAVLLPFYLRFENRRFDLRLFDAIPLTDDGAPQRVADCIQIAMLDNFQQWTCAGHPAMYAFAPAK